MAEVHVNVNSIKVLRHFLENVTHPCRRAQHLLHAHTQFLNSSQWGDKELRTFSCAFSDSDSDIEVHSPHPMHDFHPPTSSPFFQSQFPTFNNRKSCSKNKPNYQYIEI